MKFYFPEQNQLSTGKFITFCYVHIIADTMRSQILNDWLSRSRIGFGDHSENITGDVDFKGEEGAHILLIIGEDGTADCVFLQSEGGGDT